MSNLWKIWNYFSFCFVVAIFHIYAFYDHMELPHDGYYEFGRFFKLVGFYTFFYSVMLVVAAGYIETIIRNAVYKAITEANKKPD